jgi:hypothetical protein
MKGRLVRLATVAVCATCLLAVPSVPSAGAFTIKNELRSESKQLDEIQAELKHDRAVLQTLDNRTAKIRDAVGVGRVSFSQNTIYDLVVGIYQCVKFGCTT